MTDKHFKDWFDDTFQYGYGSGEEYTVPALLTFFECLKEDAYNYRDIENALSPLAGWLMIDILNQAGLFEYGTSSRNAWLTSKGKILAGYLKGKTPDDLQNVLDMGGDLYIHCYRTHCNCTEPCLNPLFAADE